MENNFIQFITCGSVDDGKSTLIGRLLYDTNSIFEDQLETLQSDSKKFGTIKDNIDYALLTDGLLSEREQGITIDVAYKYFDIENKKFIIADTPGHEQYTRNMATAASTSDIAIILIDATKGISTQTIRHLFITTFFGIKDIVVAINKMDLVDYSEDVFTNIVNDFKSLLSSKFINENIKLQYIPISALHGENITFSSVHMIWYQNSTLLEFLKTVQITKICSLLGAILPVQYVNRPNSEFRGYCGTLLNSTLNINQKVKILPSNQSATIENIIVNSGYKNRALADEAITITLKEQIDINRGDMIVAQDSTVQLFNQFEATLVWMDTKEFVSNTTYELKIYTKNIQATLEINFSIDMRTLQRRETHTIKLNDIVSVTIKLNTKLPLTLFDECKELGSFILIDKYTNNTSAAGVITNILEPQKNLFLQHHTITKELRVKNLHQKPYILWFTGLSCSGKSTIANEIEKELYKQGYKTYLLDGDNLRHTLNSDLGFSQQDREENIRRTAHLAKILVDAGLIVITAFISPYTKDREFARSLVAKDEFIEIFVDTSLEVCESRDSKGLYKKARAGEIKDFTGINSPYEKPINAEIIIKDTSLEKSVQQILNYLKIGN